MSKTGFVADASSIWYDELAKSKFVEVSCIMLCPKCNKEMSRGILGGRGNNYFLPQGEMVPKLLTDRILKKKNATLLPPDEYGSWDVSGWPDAFWCNDCKIIVADYSHLMK